MTTTSSISNRPSTRSWYSIVASKSSSWTGKYVYCICPASALSIDESRPRGPYTCQVLPAWNSGAKNGRPWMWSQCVWPMRRWPFTGPPSRSNVWPSSWIPVPPSSTSSVPASVRTDTHDVLPP